MSRLTWMQQSFAESYSTDPAQAAALLDALAHRNLSDFRYALEVMKCNPNLLDASSGLSVFQTVLQTPNSAEFIRLCINNGANFYKKASNNKYPIHLVVISRCPVNLRAFLKNYDPSKINLKVNGQNSLHLIINTLSNRNYIDSVECIKILLEHGCNPNMPNDAMKTPFYMLLKKQSDFDDDENLVKFIADNYKIDYWTYRNHEMIKMMENQNPAIEIPPRPNRKINYEFMLDLLNNRSELEFEIFFKAFKEEVGSKLADHCLRFLEIAVAHGMRDTVDYLLENRVDVNKQATDAKYSKPPAFLACANGYFRILELLLKRPELQFQFTKENEKFTLLHEVCQNFANKLKENRNVNFQKCFDLIIKDSRCQINAEDDIGCSALHYIVKYRNDAATIALLKKGAYINEESIFGKTPIDEISRTTLEAFLDECITARDKKINDIHIDYSFLIAPNRNRSVDSADKDGFCREISPLKRIADNEELRSLVTHPVLSSFLFLKWSKLSFLFYTNLVLFTFFMTTFITFIVLCQSTPKDERGLTFTTFRILSWIQLWILMIRELLQCILSFRHYFKSPMNWFEIVLILLAWKVFLLNYPTKDDDHEQRVLRAILILFAAFEFLQIVGTLPIMSVSTHMVMLKRVSITFFKSIVLYSILLLSFGLVFFMLFGESNIEQTPEPVVAIDNRFDAPESNTSHVPEEDESFKTFRYPGIAIIRVFVMLTGEFDATDLPLNSTSYLLIFTLFVFLITIVLFNLLNALAVSDTAEIRKKGELIDLVQRINVLESYEKIIFNEQSNNSWLGPKLRAFISLFPKTIPNGRIIIRASKNNEILTFRPKVSSSSLPKLESNQSVELENFSRKSFRKINFNDDLLAKLQKYSRMSPEIVKKINTILSERDERKHKIALERKMKDDIESIKIQMEMQLRLINEILSKQGSD
ncbi:hypothetical protein PVAND_014885 [Polypedilum vanderplanki]|uniref:Ion transport domain-containing protein n=1 Tax=Polypedilum vanderplanki TaxID=319348 RepID=A0A9J6BB07_POLVA|nr:hypothetical protein PVAND_014885 [Polypedilum vanderplanki]